MDGVADESPIRDKADLLEDLSDAIAELTAFSTERGIDAAAIRDATGFDREKLKDDTVAAVVVNDDIRRRYLQLASTRGRLELANRPDAAFSMTSARPKPLVGTSAT